jgi:hypothetical protein
MPLKHQSTNPPASGHQNIPNEYFWCYLVSSRFGGDFFLSTSGLNSKYDIFLISLLNLNNS